MRPRTPFPVRERRPPARSIENRVSCLEYVRGEARTALSMFERLFAKLNEAGVRYVVVGGVAAVMHGHARLTADVDLVVDLAPDPARRIVDALTGLGLSPSAPVKAADFADPSIRESWITEKGMVVFPMVDLKNPMRAVDLFARYPLDFDALWSRADVIDLNGIGVRVASIDDLIAMKRDAGRPLDLDDVGHLERIRARRSKNPSQ